MIYSRVSAFLAGLMAIAPAAAWAQNRGSIEGKVVLEASGQPLHHATVLVLPVGRTAETGDDGTYRVNGLAAGAYEVLAHMHSLTGERVRVEVTATEAARADFRLKLAPVREQITVTASGKEETTLESFLPSASLDATDLTSQSATSLGDVIENQAGVAKRTSGPGTSRPVIRGFDGDRVLILQDGIRTGTLSSQSGDHGEPIDPNVIDRVEIVRGPSTLLYEGNAIGGVVNVITGHHQIHQHPHEGVRGYVTGLGGTNDFRRGSSAGIEYGIKEWLLHADGGALYSDDYSSAEAMVPNSFSNIRNVMGGVGRYGRKYWFNSNYGVRAGRYGIPFEEDDHGHDHHALADAAGDHDGHGHENVALRYRLHNVRLNWGVRDLSPAVNNFHASLNYTDWNHKELDGEEIGNEFFNKQFVYRGVFEQEKRGRLSGSFGFWGLARDYKAAGAEANTPPVKQNAVAGFAVEQMDFEHFRLQFGARVEHSRFSPREGRNRNFTGVSGSAGINAPLWRGGAFVANYTTSFRSPALEELYAFGPHAGNLTFEIGDPSLKNERGHGADFSLRHQTSRLRAEGNFFYYRLNNYIFLRPTGDEEDGFPVGEFAQGDSRYRGAEGRLSFGLHPNLWAHAGVDAVNAELRNPVVPLPRIPPLRGRIGFDARCKGFSLMPELVLANRQDRVYALEEPTAGYAVVNVKALYSAATQHTLHIFGASLFNASDRLYRNHLSFIKAFAPEIGRGVLFTYTMRFF